MKNTRLLPMAAYSCAGAFGAFVMAEFLRMSYRLPLSLGLALLGTLLMWLLLRRQRTLGFVATAAGITAVLQTVVTLLLSPLEKPFFTTVYLLLCYALLQYLAVSGLTGKEPARVRGYADAFLLLLFFYSLPRWDNPLQGDGWVILPLAALLLAGVAAEGGGGALRPLPALGLGTAAAGAAGAAGLLVSVLCAEGVSGAVRRLGAAVLRLLKTLGRLLDAFLQWLASLLPEPAPEELPPPDPEGAALPAGMGEVEEVPLNYETVLAVGAILVMLAAAFVLWRLRGVKLGGTAGEKPGKVIITRRRPRRNPLRALWAKLRLRWRLFRQRRTPEGILRRTERLARKTGRPRGRGESIRAFLTRFDPQGHLRPVLRSLELRYYAGESTEDTPRADNRAFRALRREIRKAERASRRAQRKAQAKKSAVSAANS